VRAVSLTGAHEEGRSAAPAATATRTAAAGSGEGVHRRGGGHAFGQSGPRRGPGGCPGGASRGGRGGGPGDRCPGATAAGPPGSGAARPRRCRPGGPPGRRGSPAVGRAPGGQPQAQGGEGQQEAQEQRPAGAQVLAAPAVVQPEEAEAGPEHRGGQVASRVWWASSPRASSPAAQPAPVAAATPPMTSKAAKALGSATSRGRDTRKPAIPEWATCTAAPAAQARAATKMPAPRRTQPATPPFAGAVVHKAEDQEDDAAGENAAPRAVQAVGDGQAGQGTEEEGHAGGDGPQAAALGRYPVLDEMQPAPERIREGDSHGADDERDGQATPVSRSSRLVKSAEVSRSWDRRPRAFVGAPSATPLRWMQGADPVVRCPENKQQPRRSRLTGGRGCCGSVLVLRSSLPKGGVPSKGGGLPTAWLRCA
jgi:hypothetical protein